MQTYKNTVSDSQIECSLIIPKIDDFVMGKMQIKVGDADIIEGKVLKREQAKQKYEDAIASGHTAVMAKEDKKADLIKVMIGNLLVGQEAVVEIEMISMVKMDMGAYCVKIPIQFFPPTQVEFPYKYSLLMDVRTTHALQYLSCPKHSNIKKYMSDEIQAPQNFVQIELTDMPSNDIKKDFIIYFKTANMEEPSLVY